MGVLLIPHSCHSDRARWSLRAPHAGLARRRARRPVLLRPTTLSETLLTATFPGKKQRITAEKVCHRVSSNERACLRVAANVGKVPERAPRASTHLDQRRPWPSGTGRERPGTGARWHHPNPSPPTPASSPVRWRRRRAFPRQPGRKSSPRAVAWTALRSSRRVRTKSILARRGERPGQNGGNRRTPFSLLYQ